ncbi:hypothetical protein [Blastococcus sp. TF02-8]|uniref:hypothetical protein n=1 Tax=Blastococcus sp. TF02-8 TaxID=2250574 RepID=UPI0014134900|nr:hypothetical protein [Blastococcus sp. TF02-8]
MTSAEHAGRFRQLPDPIGPDDAVETVDVADRPPVETEREWHDRMLREAGGA